MECVFCKNIENEKDRKLASAWINLSQWPDVCAVFNMDESTPLRSFVCKKCWKFLRAKVLCVDQEEKKRRYILKCSNKRYYKITYPSF